MCDGFGNIMTPRMEWWMRFLDVWMWISRDMRGLPIPYRRAFNAV